MFQALLHPLSVGVVEEGIVSTWSSSGQSNGFGFLFVYLNTAKVFEKL